MTHGSLFSGIGGFDLAAEWMGWENKFHCEINPFGQRVLKYYWPNAISYYDIKQTDFTIWRGKLDILTGGFPCQPYSTAGKRKGKEDDRHLWPEMLRAIREIQPRWIVGENVRGLTNWNGGLVFDEVQADLEAEGYEVLPFLLPAAGVGAPHRRDRIWFIAYRSDSGTKGLRSRENEANEFEPPSNASGQGLQVTSCGKQQKISSQAGALEGSESGRAFTTITQWQDFPAQSPVCGGDDGLSNYLDAASLFNKPSKPKGARVYSKWRNESIKAYGNAIVPQVVHQIFIAIQQYETNKSKVA
jgi:DNA (cytosine-5)-methyltransferase 1